MQYSFSAGLNDLLLPVEIIFCFFFLEDVTEAGAGGAATEAFKVSSLRRTAFVGGVVVACVLEAGFFFFCLIRSLISIWMSCCKFFSIRERFLKISFFNASFCLKSMACSLVAITRFCFSSADSCFLMRFCSTFSSFSILSSIDFITWLHTDNLTCSSFCS